MLPPEPESAEPRFRTIGRRARPLALVAAVGLFALFWAFSVGAAAWGAAHDSRDRATNITWIAFWTVVVALVLWRVWRGGRSAIRFMASLGTMLGIGTLAGMAALVVLLFVAPPGGPGALLYLLPGLLGGGALLAAGRLLRRREVAHWAGF